MSMAIVLVFDPSSKAQILGMSEHLREAGVPPLGFPGPHVTLAGFEDCRGEELVQIIEELGSAHGRFNLQFDAFGIFRSPKGVLFLSPTVKRELLDVHEACYRQIHDKVTGYRDYYLPGKLAFHCTLAMGIPPDKIPLAVSATARMTSFPLKVEMVGISLLDVSAQRTLKSSSLQS
jgi:2'-5' RNA ligase